MANLTRSKFYDVEACYAKADQHYEMAGLARLDGDIPDADRHMQEARLWDDKARQGGYNESNACQ